MKRRPYAIRRTRRGRTVWVNLTEIHARAEAGTLSERDRATFNALFPDPPPGLELPPAPASENAGDGRGD